MKKLIAIVCSMILLMASVSGNAAGNAKYDALAVGTTDTITGNFFSEAFGANSSDLDVQTLIHGYSLVRWDSGDGAYVFDESVVSGVTAEEDAAGNRRYIIALADDLKYSNGKKITASDYAFSVLLSISPALEEVGGSVLHAGFIQGYDEYVNGTSKTLSGLRILGEDVLSLTISGEYRPFFYETGLLNILPYPAGVIAPGCKVTDDGQGVYLKGKQLTAEMLRKTLTDPKKGYMTHPEICSGPYVLADFDGTTVTLKQNKYYKGNYIGNKPSIQTLTYTSDTNEELQKRFENGELGLITRIVRKDIIDENVLTERDENSRIRIQNYSRGGCSLISFCCEKDTVADPAVRQAIALCVDKQQISDLYTGIYGMPADSCFGLGQWMYLLLNNQLVPEFDTEEEVRAFEDEVQKLPVADIPVWNFDPDQAAALLDQAGWTLGADGIREKTIDGKTVRLELLLGFPEDNQGYEFFRNSVAKETAKVGIAMTVEKIPFDRLVAQYYGMEERKADMYFLANDFSFVYDPSQEYDPDRPASHLNPTAIMDDELYELAIDMRKTEPEDLLGYCGKWIEFQKRLMTVLPVIPVYTNTFFDFSVYELQDYYVSEYVTWGEAIVNAYLGDAIPEEDE